MFESVEPGKFYTLEEYKTASASLQTNKESKHIFLYTTNAVQQDAYVKACEAKGYIVLKMETMVDSAFINNIELKWNDVQFVRVDSDITDNIIDKTETADSVLSAADGTTLKEMFEQQKSDLHVTVEVKGLSNDAAPVIATRPEQMRRMKDMAAMGGGGMGNFYAMMPDEVNLTVNGNHPIYKNILAETDKDKQIKLVKNLADLAFLSQGLLKGNDLTTFINRSVELMSKIEQADFVIE